MSSDLRIEKMGIRAKVVAAVLMLAGAAGGYVMGSDGGSGWNGFYCIALGVGLGTFGGLVVAKGGDRGSFTGAFVGAALMATLWLCTSEFVGEILGGIARAVFGAFLGFFLVAGIIDD
jgi:hypothetical protein